MDTLTVEHEKIGKVDIIILKGILNADTTGKLEEVLQPVSEGECPLVLFDIPELSYISSAGIGCYIGAIKQIRNKDGDIRFSNVDPKVKRVFSLLDMDTFFQFFDARDEGLASYK